MIHVLEGMSVALGSKAVQALRGSLRSDSEAGFKYLTTHSALDVDHAKLFEGLLDELDAQHLPPVIEAACDFYRLYGGVFQDIDARREVAAPAT
jgi:hypothetical protein